MMAARRATVINGSTGHPGVDRIFLANTRLLLTATSILHTDNKKFLIKCKLIAPCGELALEEATDLS
jgi:hypothetical protein